MWVVDAGVVGDVVGCVAAAGVGVAVVSIVAVGGCVFDDGHVDGAGGIVAAYGVTGVGGVVVVL